MLRPNKWWRGLWVVLPLLVTAAAVATPKIERDLAARTERAVLAAGLAAPRLSVSGRDVAVSGLSADRDRPRIAAAAAATPGMRIAATTPVELPPGDRWSWSFTRDGTSVEFAGRVNSRAAALDVAAAIRGADPSLVVLDRAVPAGGAPRDDDAMVRFASEQISRLSPGAVRHDGVGLVVSGNPVSLAAAVALRDAVRATPTAWNVHLDDTTSRMVAAIVAGRAVAGLAPAPVRIDPPVATARREVAALPATPGRVSATYHPAPRLQAAAPARGAVSSLPLAQRATFAAPVAAPVDLAAPRITPAVFVASMPGPSPVARALPPPIVEAALASPGEARATAAPTKPTETRPALAEIGRPVTVAMAVDAGPPALPPAISDTPLPPVAPVSIVPTDGRVAGCGLTAGATLPQVPLFPSGSARLDRDARAELGAIARTLSTCPGLRIAVHGHADPRGDPLTNERLARDRAAHVSQWLARHGVDAGRLTREGFGADRPTSAADHAANRRVELRVL